MSKQKPEAKQEAVAEKPKKAPVFKEGYDVRVVGTPPGAEKGEVFDMTYRIPAGSSEDAHLWGQKQAASLRLIGPVVQVVNPVVEGAGVQA